MTLRSKSFLIYKGDTLDIISQYIEREIGLDAYLIKEIKAVVLSTNVTQLTLLYNKYPSEIVDSIAPREGAIFTSDVGSSDFDIRFLFNYPVDYNSISSGSFKIDGIGIDTSKIYLDPNSNNYLLKVQVDPSFQNDSFHTYQINSNIKRKDGTTFPYTPVGGYVFHELSSAHIGDYFSKYEARKRGKVAVGVVRLSKGLSPQQGITEYLSQRQISEDRLISYSAISTSENSVDIYIIYFSKLEPQIVSGFPLNNSLLPDVSAPNKVTLVFNVKLDKARLKSVSGLFTIESGFATSVNVNPTHINLLDDLKTVEIDVSSYFISQKIYSLIARPGIYSLEGLAKEKPEQWTIHISAYAGGGGTTGEVSSAQFSGHTGQTSIHFTQAQISITSSQVSNLGSTISGYLTGLTGHTGNLNNPHGTTAAQVGAPTLATFTGHTGLTSVHFTQDQISIPASQIYDFGSVVSGYLTGIAGATGVSNAVFSAHTGDISIHFTQAQIEHSGLLGLTGDHHPQYILRNGSRSMTGELTSTVPAVDPAAYIRKFESEQADFAVYLAAATDLLGHTSNTSNPHSTTAAQVGAPTTAEFTGHTGATGVHFTQGQISIPSTQISNFTEAVQDVVGVNTFTIGVSGLHIIYNDASNTLTFGLTGSLHTGLTGHLGNRNNPHAVTAAQVGAPTTAQFTGHTGSAISHVPVFTRAGFLGVLDGSSSVVPVPIYNDTVGVKPIEPTDVFLKFDTVNDDLDSATIQDLMDYIQTYFGLTP